jgi:hypothetical protein
MLRELKKVSQIPGSSRRRWFCDDYFDLTVWYSPDNEITGFQLCYNKDQDEHAMTWKNPSTYMHHRVDDGENRATQMATPVLVSDGMFDYLTIAERFLQESSEIDKHVAKLVYEKLIKYI